jgi:hypothetical protein
MSDQTSSQSNKNRPAEDILLDLNFVPQWAKKAPGDNHYKEVSRAPRERRESRGRGGPRRETRDRPDRRPRPQQRERREHTPRPQRVELPVTIKFLPEQERLSSLVRQIHHSKRAYPLMDLAHLFLSDPRGHRVKIELNKGAEGFVLYQAKTAKIVATSREVLLNQILENHLEDYFVREETEVDPPAGNFPMIGKIDDILIGPPNHHSYTDRLAEIHRTRYAGMSFDRFKHKVQTVRDEELIEQWKQEASHKTVFRLKNEASAKEFTLVQAEEYVRTHMADSEIEEVSRVVLPSTLARKITDYNLMRMIREAWQKESLFPVSLAFSLRAAFRHLHLHTFKAGKNINFVTAVKPDPIAPSAAVENIRMVLEYLGDHPGSTRQQLVDGLRPGAEKDSAEAHEILNPIRWLVEKGHIIEFFNGTLSVPSHRRR